MRLVSTGLFRGLVGLGRYGILVSLVGLGRNLFLWDFFHQMDLPRLIVGVTLIPLTATFTLAFTMVVMIRGTVWVHLKGVDLIFCALSVSLVI